MPQRTEQNLFGPIGKAEAEVTSNKRVCSRYCTVEANYRGTCGLSATADSCDSFIWSVEMSLWDSALQQREYIKIRHVTCVGCVLYLLQILIYEHDCRVLVFVDINSRCHTKSAKSSCHCSCGWTTTQLFQHLVYWVLNCCSTAGIISQPIFSSVCHCKRVWCCSASCDVTWQ